MSLLLEPQRVLVAGEDGEAMLIFVKARLAVVLVQLSELHGELAGHWFVEAAFGDFRRLQHKVFPDVIRAQHAIAINKR